jgi:hypothetical protein
MSKKISFKLKSDKFDDLIGKIKDISNINEVVKLKINKDNILMYSMRANDTAVLALKSYYVPTTDYFEDFNEDEMYNFIIVNAPKFIKGLLFFDGKTQIKLDVTTKPHHEEENNVQVRSAQFTNGKLKILTVGGEDSKIRDIKADMLENRTDIENSEWKFQIGKQDFQDIRKLSSIDSEEKILTMNVEKGKVLAGEDSKWELFVGNANKEINYKIIFNKKYLSNINQELDIIDFYMFETFILVKDSNSNLMLSFEQTFDEND